MGKKTKLATAVSLITISAMLAFAYKKAKQVFDDIDWDEVAKDNAN